MSSTMVLSAIVLLAICSVTTVNAECTTTQGPDLCVHYLGAQYDVSNTASQATYILTQVTPTSNRNVYPCCQLCDATATCAVYSILFNNGYDSECTLYSLPNSLLPGRAYLDYLLSAGNNQCTGFAYKYVGFPSSG